MKFCQIKGEELFLKFKWNSDQGEPLYHGSLGCLKASSGCNWQGESEYRHNTLKEMAEVLQQQAMSKLK